MPHPGKDETSPELYSEVNYTMALTPHDLPINGFIRRTPPTFIPLADPRPAPVLRLVPRRVVALPVDAETLTPCRCRRCHRLLRSAPSIAAGIGPSCARKEGIAPIAMPLFAGLEVA